MVNSNGSGRFTGQVGGGRFTTLPTRTTLTAAMGAKTRKFAVAVLMLLPLSAMADQKPRDLAMESYRFIDAAQGKLDNWIKNANKGDYFTQFSSPAKTIAAKWPQPLKEEYYDYADCYFALDLLIRYADKAVVSKAWNDPEEVARKTRFTNALRECQRDLRKML